MWARYHGATEQERGDPEFPGVVDHRRPVAFAGGDEIENLQLLCRQCNNIKANVCRSCPLDYHCEKCTWAWPEKFHDTVVIQLTPLEAEVLTEKAAARSMDANVLAREILETALRSY